TRYRLALTQVSICALAPIHTSIHTTTLRKNFSKGRDPTPKNHSSRASANTPSQILWEISKVWSYSRDRSRSRQRCAQGECPQANREPMTLGSIGTCAHIGPNCPGRC